MADITGDQTVRLRMPVDTDAAIDGAKKKGVFAFTTDKATVAVCPADGAEFVHLGKDPADAPVASTVNGTDKVLISQGGVQKQTTVSAIGGGGVWQPLDSDLTAIAALTTTPFGRSLLTMAGATETRTAIGAAASADLAGYQPLDSDLTAIAALSTTPFGRSLLTLADAVAARAAIGAGTVQPADLAAYQPLDSDLTAIAALATTAFGRSLLIQADAAAVRSAIGAGTSSFSGAYASLSSIPAAIDAIDGLTPAADRIAYYTGSNAASLAPLTAFARTLLDDADASAARATLGAHPLENQRLGTMDSPEFLSPAVTSILRNRGGGNYNTFLDSDGNVDTNDLDVYGDFLVQSGMSSLRNMEVSGLADIASLNVSNSFKVGGVDRITAAGGFVGTSLQISGATANKLARFDASKNLVSYDLVAADIPALDAAKITTGTWADARIASAPTWNAKLAPSNVSGYADEVAAFVDVHTVNSDSGLKRYRTGGITTQLALGTNATADAVFAAQCQLGGTSAFRHYQGPALRFQEILRTDGSWALQAHNTYDALIDAPITVGNGAGGTIALGGGGRPVSLTDGSRLQINGTDAITSARVGDLASLKIAGVERISAAGAFTGTTGTFSGDLSWGGGVFRTSFQSAAYSALYASGVTPNGSNSVLIFGSTGLDAYLNGTVSSALAVGGNNKVLATSTGAEIAGVASASRQRYSIQSRSEANFNLGDCTSSIVVHTSPTGTVTLLGGGDGDVWYLETSGASVVVPAGVTLWLHDTSYVGPYTWSLGGGRPTMLIRVSATKWWAPNL